MTNEFLIKRKRGAISSIFSDFWAYVAFVFIVLIFYIFFTFQADKAKENKIVGMEAELNSRLALINHLRTPIEVEIDGLKRKMNMADLIVLSEIKHEEETERDKLALAKSHDILDATIGKNKLAINVCYPKGRERTEKCWLYLNSAKWQGTLEGEGGNLLSESSVLIPDLDGNQIEVKMRTFK